jgi:hypothetical protein
MCHPAILAVAALLVILNFVFFLYFFFRIHHRASQVTEATRSYTPPS